MDQFFHNDCLYLKAPTSDRLDRVSAWLKAKDIPCERVEDCTAVFTKTGRGKKSPAVRFTLLVSPALAEILTGHYPPPKNLSVTLHQH